MSDLISRFNKMNEIPSKILGSEICEMEQGSYDWHRCRLGVITASEAYKVLMKSGSGGRTKYMNELMHEVATKAPKDEVSAKALQWGKEHEPSARELMGFISGSPVRTYPIVFKDESMRCAISPDGVTDRLEEIKCSWNGAYYIDFLITGVIPKKQYDEWMKQVQFGMWITGDQFSNFTGYDPRMPRNMIKTIEVERSDKFMSLFDDAVPQFILEMDRNLELIGYQFGDQWK